MEEGLKILRLMVLLLSVGQLLVSLLDPLHPFVASLLVSLLAGLLYAQKHLSKTTHRVLPPSHSYSSCCC
jgi:hypothetical protein